MVEIINKKKTTLQAINELQGDSDLRPYMGMSGLGHSCERYLWYTFRWCYVEDVSARMFRLFNRGHREEAAIIALLNQVGIFIHDEQGEVVAVHGHVKGHYEGILTGVIEAPKTPHLAEFKTMNDKSFKDLCKSAVKVSKPVHYAQMQCYMRKIPLTRALYVAVNKNDDTMYIERVYEDHNVADTLFARAEAIILSEEPPDKKFKNTWYECKWCSANDICHKDATVESNCRTCEGCDLIPNGLWECSTHDIPLTTSQQRVGCKKYKKLESL
jgi:hypothetical protein